MGSVIDDRRMTAFRDLLERSWSEMKHTDLELICSNGSIRAHRVIVACVSPFVQSLLRHSSDEGISQVVVPHETSEVVHQYLTDLYCKMDPNNLCTLLQGSLVIPISIPITKVKQEIDESVVYMDNAPKIEHELFRETPYDEQDELEKYNDSLDNLDLLERKLSRKRKKKRQVAKKEKRKKRRKEEDEEEDLGDPEGEFKCTECEFSSNIEYHLKNHFRRVHSCFCPYCGITMGSNDKLRVHFKRKHRGIAVYVCPSCEYATPERHTMIKHRVKVHRDKSEYLCKCIYCENQDVQYKTLSELWVHLRNVHKLKKYNAAAQDNAALMRGFFDEPDDDHISEEHEASDSDSAYSASDGGGGEHKCSMCPFETAVKNQLTLHIKRAHNTFCVYCGKNFAANELLRRHHRQDHPGLAVYKCIHCNHMAVERHQMLKHRKAVHRDNTEECCPCSVCGKAFLTLRDLWAHMRKQHKMRKFTERLTLSKMVQKQQAGSEDEEAQANHEGALKEDPEYKPDLSESHAVNSNVAFTCSLCTFGTNVSYQLQQHFRRVHNTVCCYCGEKFPANEDLKQHQKDSHQGLAVYRCPHPDCDYVSAQRHQMLGHRQGAHRDNSQYLCQCTHCRNMFKTLSELWNHLRNEHNIKRHSEKLSLSDMLRENPNVKEESKISYPPKKQVKRSDGPNENHPNLDDECGKCEFCDKDFRDQMDLYDHLLSSHAPKSLHICSMCEISSLIRDSLVSHSRYDHNVDYLCKCSICDNVFDSPEAFWSHKLDRHGVSADDHCKNFIRCEECPLILPNVTMYEDHKRFDKHLKLCPQECTKSGVYLSATDLEEHTKAEHKIPCRYCGKMFDNAFRVKIHEERLHELERTCCPICGKKVAWLRTHMAQVHKTGDFNCDLCGKRYPKQSGLKYHQRVKHDIWESGAFKPKKCKICSEVFNTYDEHFHHKLNGHAEPCKICGKTYGTMMMRQHMRVAHDPSKPYQCEVCKIRYKSPAAVHWHQKVKHGINKWDELKHE